ncbi:hypothetical protein IU500_19140 [Nocardia terpenica]|uniref:hypothetical protein n=1 Tax=Nocardia terpenica TaxID=455432 RepID=UPI00189497B3|nr:hypothetical protein [Nocardia terpenica]MBF6106155.1 hypothetical protein [Nocardia terpenica]
MSVFNGFRCRRRGHRAKSPAGIREFRSRRIYFAAGWSAVPSAADVVAACDPRAVRSGDALVESIRRLARLAAADHAHATGHDDDAEELAVTHDELLRTIDRVTRQRLPGDPERDAVVHTETLAPVISRLVTLVVTRIQISQHATGSVADRTVAELDTAVADLMAAYDWLVAELVTGRRRLPRNQVAPAV